jgi:RNA polymerase sigma factor (sigma-70 family)
MKDIADRFVIEECAQSANNQIAWREFIRRFDRHIKLTVIRAYKYVAISTKTKKNISKEEVRDLVQDVYIRLVRNNCKLLKNFRPSNNGSIYAYLTLTSASVVKDYFKKTGRLKRKGSLLSICEELDSPQASCIMNNRLASFTFNNPEEQIIAKDLLGKLEEHYSSVNSKGNNRIKEMIFKLYFLKGMSIKDISRINGLNVSLNNINTIIWRMRKEIKNFVCNGSVSQKIE